MVKPKLPGPGPGPDGAAPGDEPSRATREGDGAEPGPGAGAGDLGAWGPPIRRAPNAIATHPQTPEAGTPAPSPPTGPTVIPTQKISKKISPQSHQAPEIIGGSLSDPERITLIRELRRRTTPARLLPAKPKPAPPPPPPPVSPSPPLSSIPQKPRGGDPDPHGKAFNDLLAIAGGTKKFLELLRRTRAEDSLYEFVRQAWPYIDSAPFLDSWAVEALCAHLEAVTRGDIRFLLVNFPPRCSKTLVTAVCWPVWTWLQKSNGYTSGPQTRFLGASYGQDLSFKSASKMRELIDTPWFQENWGDTLKIKEGADTKAAFANTNGGDRQATSITGKLLGFGGDIVMVDDPHNTEDVESDQQREGVLQGWREISTTRLNDPKHSALVVIMQRLNEADVSGEILANKSERPWVHLMIPMRHEPRRHCTTYLPATHVKFWGDPRTEDGELMWPERFDLKAIRDIEEGLGPYMASGRLQQSPTPKGGGIIKREWWNVWPPAGEDDKWSFFLPNDPTPKIRYPDFDLIFASIDTAYTSKEENDWSACTVWGCFEDSRNRPRIMLISAWRVRLELNDLVNKIIATTARKNLECSAVLVENKASGLSVAQELKRLSRAGAFTLHMIDPRHAGGGDKVARMYAAQPSFSAGLIYAPDTSWAEMVIGETEMFPKGRHDDLSDTVSQAVNWLRKRGIARMSFEHEQDIKPRAWTGRQDGIAAEYGV